MDPSSRGIAIRGHHASLLPASNGQALYGSDRFSERSRLSAIVIFDQPLLSLFGRKDQGFEIGCDSHCAVFLRSMASGLRHPLAIRRFAKGTMLRSVRLSIHRRQKRSNVNILMIASVGNSGTDTLAAVLVARHLRAKILSVGTGFSSGPERYYERGTNEATASLAPVAQYDSEWSPQMFASDW